MGDVLVTARLKTGFHLYILGN